MNIIVLKELKKVKSNRLKFKFDQKFPENKKSKTTDDASVKYSFLWSSPPPQLIWDSEKTNTGTISTDLLSNGYAYQGIPASSDWNTIMNNYGVRITLLEDGSFQTGDRKDSYNPTPMPGWIICQDGTIGNAASGASIRANDDTQALFILFWNICDNTICPVLGGRGASAAADFSANKQLTIPSTNGRSAVNCISNYPVGSTFGSNSVSLTESQNGPHSHNLPGSAVTFINGSTQGDKFSGSGGPYVLNESPATSSSGQGDSHENRPPGTAVYVHLKL